MTQLGQMVYGEEASTLGSLLGLLHPIEFFVTVDNSVLWQRHIAWSKPKGENLRQHVTQRYASNMVFLSCLLAAEINVFFNSSRELTDMRSLLGSRNYEYIRYWIGVCIMMDACVTILALVTTFTLWGMVSSISDTNTHALLRSSIGQYVTGLPARFTVAALYLFLSWMCLFIVDLLRGPLQIFLLILVLSIFFFQVVIPLSAFGRLIIHTGAMAKRPVLDENLEKELLPSGLHASLLIRATDRRRKYASATDQYAKQNKRSSSNPNKKSSSSVSFAQPPSGGEGGGTAPAAAASSHSHSHSHAHPAVSGETIVSHTTSNQSSYHPSMSSSKLQHFYARDHKTSTSFPPTTISTVRPRTESDELTIDFGESSSSLMPQVPNDRFSNPDDYANHSTSYRHLTSAGSGGVSDSPVISRGHRRMETADTVGSENFFFPQPSVLNASLSRRDIQDVVEQAIKSSSSGGAGAEDDTKGRPASGNLSTDSSLTQSQYVQSSDNSNWYDNFVIANGPSFSTQGDDGTNKHFAVDTTTIQGFNGEGPMVFDAPPAQGFQTIDGRQGGYHQRRNSYSSRVARGVIPPRSPLDRSPFTTQQRKRFGATNASPQSSSLDIIGHDGYQQQQQSGNSNSSNAGYQDRSQYANRGGNNPASNRPPRRHRERRRSSSRMSSGSLLGFLALPSPKEEWEEENEVRAVFDAPPSADLDSHEQIVEDLESSPFHQKSRNSDKAMITSKTPNVSNISSRRASSEYSIYSEDNANDRSVSGSLAGQNIVHPQDDPGVVVNPSSNDDEDDDNKDDDNNKKGPSTMNGTPKSLESNKIKKSIGSKYSGRQGGENDEENVNNHAFVQDEVTSPEAEERTRLLSKGGHSTVYS